MSKELLLALFLLSIVSYFFLNRKIRQSEVHRWRTFLDKYIPFAPVFVVSYIVLYPFILITFILLWQQPAFESLMIALILANFAAAAFYYLVPTGVIRPAVDDQSLFSKLVRLVYHLDKPVNCFPSGHVFHALICASYLWQSFPQLGWQFFLIGSFIALSGFLIKQHYLVDLAGGALWAVLARTIAWLITGA